MIYHPDTSDFPGGEEQFLKDYRPSAGRMFKIGMGAGFDDTLPGLLTSLSVMDQAENQPLLTKEDWEASKFYDPEIKWDDSFTTPKARLLKERRDRERELGFLMERAGMGATASFYAGAIVGTVPDPVNYIPFVGIASKAKSAAVLGKIAQSGRLGRGATTATDAVLGTALIQPLVAAERDTYQLKYDTRDALTELGLALGLGFGLGAALGRVHPKDPDPAVRAQEGTVTVNRKGDIEIKAGRAPDPETPSTRAAANIAPQDAKTAIDVAAAQQAAGESINVGKFAPTQPVRQTADGAEAPEVTPAEVWQSDIPRTPEPTPVPDPTPISQNQAQLDAADARASERIAQLENSDKPLTEEEARVLALDDEDVRRNDTFVEATNAAVECMIANA